MVIVMVILTVLPCFSLVITNSALGLNYSTNTNLSGVDASFIGENDGDFSGWSVAIAGDMNGDGYEDLLIGAKFSDEYASFAGESYIVFGKKNGWAMDNSLSNPDASFRGEYSMDMSGEVVASAGDINGDGYDDILIAAPNNDENGTDSGQVYIILGKATGWKNNSNLSMMGASFWGEAESDHLGRAIGGGGDVNGDGFDDFLIGAPDNDEGGFSGGQTYLILGRASGWTKDMELSGATASFIQANQSNSGSAVACSGDVNGDGFDDIVIGSSSYDTDAPNHGAVYVFFGKESGWTMHTDVSNANASFIGESAHSNLGQSVAIAGDVDGDGYEDILMGASGFDSHRGKVYLAYGRESGWPTNLNMTNAEAAFTGQDIDNLAGMSVSSAGDVNGDGYDDILIGAYKNDAGALFTGKTYIVLGDPVRYAGNISLANANASFRGEATNDYSGRSVSGGGDVNGDGYDDILIGAYGNIAGGGNNAGQTYLVFPDTNTRPTTVASVKAYSDGAYTQEITTAPVLIHQQIFVELTGTDGDPTSKDIALVNITSETSSPVGFKLRLEETLADSGKYRGSFTVTNRTHEKQKLIKAVFAENVTVESVLDSTKYVTFTVVDPPKLRPLIDNTTAQEDSPYFEHYWSVGNPVTEWVFDTNASWLEWNGTTHNISGIPDNGDVGSFWVRINITNGLGFYDEHYFTIDVNNTPPMITTTDVLGAIEDQEYSVNYTSTDDGQGNVSWHLDINSTWLSINSTTGNLTGTPGNEHVGIHDVNVSVHDGNGGRDWTVFQITVTNTNDVPQITTEDVNTTYEDEYYNVTYEATDVDAGDNIFWSFESNASWLTMDQSKGRIYGTPGNSQVGEYWVNVTVTDSSLASDSHNFTLAVINVNDPPEITSNPVREATVFYEYRYLVEATDMDPFDELAFSFDESPGGMAVDGTGLITWMPTKEQKGLNPVIVNVSDGNVTVVQRFNITVAVPQVSPILPENGSIVYTLTPELYWSFSVNLSSIVYDVYLDTDPAPSAILVRDQDTKRYVIAPPLADNTTYYWKIVPKSGNLTGESSPVWNFRTETSLQPGYSVKLDLDRSNITAHPGDTVYVNMTVLNNGILDGQVLITLNTSLAASMFEFQASVHLTAKASRTIQLNITIPKNLEMDDYYVSISAKLGNSTSKDGLILSVVKKPVPIVDLWEDPAIWLVMALIIVMAVIGIAYVTIRRRKIEKELATVKSQIEAVEDFTVDEIFLIYNDGRLITHVSHKGSEIDKQVFSAMLVAVQNFVKDSFKADGGLTSFTFGSRKMILEKGRFLILAVALSGTEPKILKGRLADLVQKVEGLYSGVVEEWDGNITAFKNVGPILVPLFYLKEGMKIKKEKEEVKILSGVEFFSGFVRLKVAVKNELQTAIKDITLALSYDDKLLKLDHIEPDYPLKGSIVFIDHVGKNEKRTVAFYLDPTICQESHVECKATFKDEFDNTGEAVMKTRAVDIVCPIFYTPETINVAMLKRLLGDMRYRDSKVYRLAPQIPIQKVYEIAKLAIQKHDVKMVREYSEFDPFANEAWYYGSTSETEEEIVIRVTVREDTNTLEIFVACTNLGSMTGLLAEIGHNINQLAIDAGFKVLKPSTDPGLKKYLDQKPKLMDTHQG
jgi:hypothetical protein